MGTVTIALALAAAAVIAPSLAQAAPTCTSEAKDKWMSVEAKKAKAGELGYERIRTFKVSSNCYEIYGYTNDGKKADMAG